MSDPAPVDLLKALIQISTVNPPGDELPAARYLHEVFCNSGIFSEVVPLDGNRAGVVARLRGRRSDQCLVFSGHLDVVPTGDVAWTHEAFAAEEADGRIYGRGASDMKAGVTAMVAAMQKLQAEGITPPHDVLFVGSAGEESGCVGARHLAERGYLADAGGIVISEPSENNLVYAHKGALWLAIETTGHTAHGSMPHLGINAVEGMIRILDSAMRALERDFSLVSNPDLGSPTASINRIIGGVKTNVIPDGCRAEIDVRTIPEQNHEEIVRLVTEVTQQAATSTSGMTVHVECFNDLPGFFTSTDHPFLSWVRDVAYRVRGSEPAVRTSPGYTDASIYAGFTGVPVVVLGPGTPSQAHQPDEWVDLSHYQEAIKIYEELARTYAPHSP